MAIENISGSLFMDGYDNSSPPKKSRNQYDRGRVRNITEKVEADPLAFIGSTYRLGRIRSNEVISIDSNLYWDDLDAAPGAGRMDVGFEAPQIVNDPTALASGLDITAAGSSVLGPIDIGDIGKMAWEYVAGLTEDPGGSFDIVAYLTVNDIDQGGTIALEMKVIQA